ncbi:DUF742 domain-containing protein [Nocardia sp. NPDC049149]|uniref:DUF742 domain-containing protein n=1 Tax=Nocardia sp. NPDC049149 TaxID=3364315 RepID=UPI003714C071
MTEQAIETVPAPRYVERPLGQEIRRTVRNDVPDRLYVLTGGRSTPDSHAFDPATLVVSMVESAPDMPTEQVAILDMCQTPTIVADIATNLGLPIGVTTILLSDLLRASKITVRQPQPAPNTLGARRNTQRAAAPEEVPSGLRNV